MCWQLYIRVSTSTIEINEHERMIHSQLTIHNGQFTTHRFVLSQVSTDNEEETLFLIFLKYVSAIIR